MRTLRSEIGIALRCKPSYKPIAGSLVLDPSWNQPLLLCDCAASVSLWEAASALSSGGRTEQITLTGTVSKAVCPASQADPCSPGVKAPAPCLFGHHLVSHTCTLWDRHQCVYLFGVAYLGSILNVFVCLFPSFFFCLDRMWFSLSAPPFVDAQPFPLWLTIWY